MPSKAKVGQWLSSSGNASGEANDSGSDSGSESAGGSMAGGRGRDMDDDDEDDEDVEEDLLDKVAGKLRGGKLNARLEALETDLEVTSTFPPRDILPTLLPLLLSNLPRYSDSRSQEAVVKVLSDLIKRELTSDSEENQKAGEKLAGKLAEWVRIEVQEATGTSKTIAASNLFPHLLLALSLYQLLSLHLPASSPFSQSDLHPKLVLTIGLALNEILSPPSHAKEESVAKGKWKGPNTIGKGAVGRTRRAIRDSPHLIPNVFDALLDGLKISGVKLLPLLGVTLAVALRLKPVNKASPAKPGAEFVESYKGKVLQAWLENVLSSKTALPGHLIASCDDLWTGILSAQEFTEKVIPVAEKMLVRSPEVATPVLSHVVSEATLNPLDMSLEKLVPGIISASKSSNAITRQRAGQLMRSILATLRKQMPDSEDVVLNVVQQVLLLPTTGKTTSADNRICLFEMLDAELSPKVSAEIVKALAPLAGKETSEPALSAMMDAISTHLSLCLQSEVTVLDPKVTQALTKDLTSNKAATRRLFFSRISDALWASGRSAQGWSADGWKLAEACLPAFESTLKTVSATGPAATGAAAGTPVEAYMVVALTLDPMQKSGATAAIEKFLTTNAVVTGLASLKPKPSFLLSDRIYRKTISDNAEPASAAQGRTWMLRAFEALLSRSKKAKAEEPARLAAAGAIVLTGFEAPDRASRSEAVETIGRLALKSGWAASGLLLQAVDSQLRQIKTSTIVSDSQAEFQAAAGQTSYAIVSAIAKNAAQSAKAAGKDGEAAEAFLEEALTVCHHPIITAAVPDAWISLAISMGVVLDAFAEKRQDSIMTRLSALDADPLVQKGALSAAATMAFIAPSIYIPRILQQVAEDLDPLSMDYVRDTEIGIWNTPEGELFVDVLNKKKDVVIDKNTKSYAQDKWDQEVRAAIAKKKAGSGPTISKQDQALMDAQAKVEADTRTRMRATQTVMRRGLAFIDGLLARRVAELEDHTQTMMQLVLTQAVGPASILVGVEACSTFLALSALCTPRLGPHAPFIGVTILRAEEATSLPEDLVAEPLGSQVIRVLQRVSGLSLSAPIDKITAIYTAPLLHAVVKQGGVGTTSETKDEALEQLTLVSTIYEGLADQLENTGYPRAAIIQDLLTLATGQPALAKDAVSSLVAAGQAMKDNATKQDLGAFFSGLLVQDSYVRSGSLQAIQPIDLTDLDYAVELFIARFDEDQPNANLADAIWEENAFEVPEDACKGLLPFLSHTSAAVRSGAACAIAAAAIQHESTVTATLLSLRELYGEKAKILAPEFDKFGMVIAESLDRSDPWEPRSAIALAFEEMAPVMAKQHVQQFFEFLVLHEALGDRDGRVRQSLLQAGITIIDKHGKMVLADLVAVFETCLGQQGAEGSSSSDHVRESVVILFGRLARHLPPGDTRIPRVVDRLLVALETPSEVVQVAVADCLPALVKAMPSESERFLESLFSQLIAGEKYGMRRGAAYGIAGIIKGRGLSLMTDFELMSKLREAVADKKNYEARQGAVLAFETLTATLGRAFEPYIISVIPMLLTTFGDGNVEVREATSDASKVIMSKISGHCVKMILPLLLSGLEEKQWRVKKGSIELLGAMAYCAPKQLSGSLPTIIPELTGVLTDSHTQVRTAANTSLKTFGEVLSNPEIKRMQPVLLKALSDPIAKTNSALTALLGTSFEHYLDSPSLALVIPIIDRGLKERSSDMKRKSVQILGNLSSLTESRDFIPYLEQLMPLVQIVLVDPVPEARATAAKALGTLVERLGEDNFPSLVSKLLQTLRSEVSGVDRQGAAQGLSEVLAGLGMSRMEGLLPDIITNATSPRSYVKEGFISLLVYLPATFGQRFGPHLGRIIPPILGGLADESEYVRDASMRAGKMIIANYSSRAIELLLPELERGMLDSAWRIRQSSIALTGELLYKVTGISGKVEIEEDEAPAHNADAARKALTEALGQEGRDRVLSHLYIVRQDAVGPVRQASIHIWKALVHNTPRTTREILPMLVQMIISLLGAESHEQQETASRTLGELCRKNGERILGEIMPMLKEAVNTGDAGVREGACTAFNEIMLSASEDHLEAHEDTIIASVRKALVDEEPNVRIAAAKAFDTMQEYIGPKAIDQTIPTLLEAMRTPGASSETALMALREVMSVRAATVFPTLLPTLTVQPITAFNARALASLVSVAGNALSKRLQQVILPLVKSLETETDEETREELEGAIRSLLASIEDLEGLHALEMLLLGWAKEEAASRRAEACDILATFCEVTEMDTSNYRVDWVRQLITLFDDSDETVVTAAWKALEALIKTVEKDRLEELAVPMRRSIESIGGRGKTVSGFCRPKGIQSIAPVLLAGLLGGTQEQREQSALAIGDVVQRTTEAAIKPYIIQLTGPLIRVITGGNVAVQIKTGILSTLTVLLEEVPQLVRPFHPQLTRTMIKSASDPASLSVRARAAVGLGELMKHQPRVDPVVTELTTGVKTAESDIAPSMAEALAAVCISAGNNIGAAAKAGVLELIEEAFGEKPPDVYSNAIAKVLAGLSKHDSASVAPIIKDQVLARETPTPLKSICIYQILSINPSLFIELDVVEAMGKAVLAYVGFDQAATSRPSRESRDILRVSQEYKGQAGIQALL